MKIKFMLHSFSPESMIGLTFEVHGIWQYRRYQISTSYSPISRSLMPINITVYYMEEKNLKVKPAKRPSAAGINDRL